MPSSRPHLREEEWQAIQLRLAEVLAQRGRNLPKGGDYYLIDKDPGTYEQKVLIFNRDVLTPEVLDAAGDLLWDYSRDWRILFVEAKEDGTEMIPRGGLKVSAYGLQTLRPPKISPEEARKTRELYESLEHLLSAHGKSDAFGNGDYWIVDDGWAPLSHKVCIFTIEFLTPRLAAEVQGLLKEKFPAYAVWFQIEVLEPGVEIPLPGIRVFADRIEHDWDRDRMRSLFKDRFAW
jgi:hypothetical protein